MISPELIRRYDFFSGLDHDCIVALAKAGQELEVKAGFCFFTEGKVLNKFYLVIEGTIGIFIEVPDRDISQKISDQLTGKIVMKNIQVATVSPGNIFAWSALVSPHFTTASAQALTYSRVLAFDCQALDRDMDRYPQFRLLMVEKAAQVVRERMRDMRIEILGEFAP